MKTTFSAKKLFVCILAVVLSLMIFTGCGSSASLTASLESAKEKVSVFARTQHRNDALFSKNVFSKAKEAAEKITDDTTEKELETIAQELSLDGITVVDETCTVVLSYPEGEEGKTLKDLGEKREFSWIVKNISEKQMTEPVLDPESGEYSLFAGVKRTDGTGAVIISMKTADYADVCGAALAQECGENTVIIKDNAVLSSSLEGVSAQDTLDKLGLTEDDLQKDSFEMTVDGQKYQCKSATVDDYTIICAAAA